MQIYLKSLGCRLNEAELEGWARDFQQRGDQITTDPAYAELVVVNTCAVTGEAVRKSRKLMQRIHRDSPHAKLVASGCFTSLQPEQSAATLGIDLVVHNRDKDRLVEIISEQLELHTMPQLATQPVQSSLLQRGRQRAFIKVQDGCRYQCTFCVVTLARGEERSRPIGEVVDEINLLQQQGIKEVALTGVHIGGYGSDCNSDLQQLVSAVLSDTRIPRLRLGAVEPWDLPQGFWRLFDNPRFIPHLHLPLQSGADTVLRRMARRCKRSEFQQLVAAARERVADFNLTTDVIVGFPGESSAEWQQTLTLLQQIGLGHLHIFSYSSRPGTRAASLPDPVPRELIRQRSQQLHALGEQMKQQTMAQYVGRTLPVLVEGQQDRHGRWLGYTPNFLRVAISAATDETLTNQIIDVRLHELAADGGLLLGQRVSSPAC